MAKLVNITLALKDDQLVNDNTVGEALVYCYYPKVDEKEGSWGEVLDKDNSQLWEREDEEK